MVEDTSYAIDHDTFHVPDVVVRQRRVQDLEVCVVDVLKDKTGCLALRIADDIEKLDDVRTSAQVLQDFDLPANNKQKKNDEDIIGFVRCT